MYDLSARNPFIQTGINQLYFPISDQGKGLSDLYKQASFFRKEYDLETSLKIVAFLRWKEPSKDKFFLSPLIYKPCQIIHKRKIESHYDYEVDSDSKYQINPILVKSLKRFYDVELPSDCDEVSLVLEELSGQLSGLNDQLKLSTELDEEEEWRIFNVEAIGNFNYKKSLLGADYDRIIQNSGGRLEMLFRPNSITEVESDVNQITQLDDSQLKAVRYAQQNNLVIQGPPGTGKSQTIVGLIGNYISQGKKVLFVSQKKSALEVVKNRLDKLGLGHLLAYLDTEKNEKKSFYNNLRKSWEKIHERVNFDFQNPNSNVLLSDFYLNQYTEYDERLDQSIFELTKHLSEAGEAAGNIKLSGRIPSLAEWRQHLPSFKRIEKQLQVHSQSRNLAESFLVNLNKAVFSEVEPIEKLKDRLEVLSDTLVSINSLAEKYKLERDLKRITHLSIASSILNMVNRSQLDVLNIDSKAYVQFGNLVKKYQKVQLKVERAELANKKWVNKPSKLEITELIDLIKHRHAPRGILGVLKRKNERLTEAFRDFDRNLSDVAKLQLLEELRNEWNLKTELQEIELKLQHNFNIKDPKNEVDQILKMRNRLDEISKNSYIEILEHEESTELIADLSDLHPKIQNFNHLLKFIFIELKSDELDYFERIIGALRKDADILKLISPEVQLYFKLPVLSREILAKNSYSVDELTNAVEYANLIEVTRLKPAFDDLNGASLQQELNQLLDANKQRIHQEAKIIFQRHFKEIENIDKLLTTPASKLNEAQKIEKKNLKAQHRIFIHEIAKQQAHMPVKQFTDQCWDLLSRIAPVWIMNPLSVSERLNCQEDLFDVVIFDESSQIPLEDAIPAIYRSAQIIVVGDSKQMPPSSFFSSNDNSITLLDQAEKVFYGEMLKWHYRSEHPALVNFSNGYFYDNELQVLPPVSSQIPIELIRVNGIFEDRVNKKESEEIANYLSKKSEKELADIGVIAFSKDQELQIRKDLHKKKIDVEKLLIRNLENVQGIERDTIIISVGYGRSSEGAFRLNFGPVNQQSGANRLNVLFTRSKRKMVVFTSVNSDDFGLTDNYGVNCLKDFLRYAEDIANDTEKGSNLSGIDLVDVVEYDSKKGSSIHCYVQHQTSKVLLIDPCLKDDFSTDLLTMYDIMKSRFKRVKILLSQDRFKSEERFRSEILKFFN